VRQVQGGLRTEGNETVFSRFVFGLLAVVGQHENGGEKEAHVEETYHTAGILSGQVGKSRERLMVRLK
jgi:hypothetical protein